MDFYVGAIPNVMFCVHAIFTGDFHKYGLLRRFFPLFWVIDFGFLNRKPKPEVDAKTKVGLEIRVETLRLLSILQNQHD